MDEQRLNDNRIVLVSMICIAISVILSKLSIGSLLFNLPLLLLVPRIRKTAYAVLNFVVSMVLMTAVTLYDFKDYLGTEYLGIVLFALFFQVVASIGAIVWTALRNFSNSVLRKLVICSFPIATMGIALSILMNQPFAEGIVSGLKVSLTSFFEALPLNVNVEEFSGYFVRVLQLMVVPLGIAFSGFQIVISELIINKRDENWQNDFAYMKMPNYYIWVFMASWVIVILSGLIVIPLWICIISWNIALGLALHYLMGGISVVTFLVRKRSKYITANRLFIPIVVLCIVPGVNVVVFAGLTILGALETWLKMR